MSIVSNMLWYVSGAESGHGNRLTRIPNVLNKKVNVKKQDMARDVYNM